MPDHRDDIPLEELQIYVGDELIFDGSDPSTYVVLHPDTAAEQLAELFGELTD